MSTDGRNLDVLLVFPPVAIEATFAELGMPRIVAYLRRLGYSVLQFDLNVELVKDYMFQPQEIFWLVNTMYTDDRAPPDIPVLIDIKEVYERISVMPTDQLIKLLKDGHYLDFVHAITRTYVHRRGLWLESYYIEDVLERIKNGNPFLERFYEQRLFSRLEHSTPKIVGISVASSEQTYPGLVLSKLVKERWPEAFVVWGGPWASSAGDVLPNFLRAFEWVDAVSVYEGELAVSELVKALFSRTSLDNVPNLLYRDKDGRVRATQVKRPIPFSELPPPDFSDLPLKLYQDQMLPVQTTRNCHWGRCIFCYHRISSAAERFEERDPKQVVDIIEHLKARTGMETYFLADSSTRLVQMLAIANELLKRQTNITWLVMSRSTGTWTKERCKLLADSGLVEVYVGLESASEKRLKQINKGITLDRLERDLENMAAAGIRALVFVLDYPSQTEEELEATFQWVVDHADSIAYFVAQRFELGRTSLVFRKPELIGITPDPRADFDLDIYSHRYTAKEQVPLERYNELHRKYLIEFLKRKGQY